MSGTVATGAHPSGFNGQDAYNDRLMVSKEPHYIVRRLTPHECAKLQGFPEDWCDGIQHSDASEYKLWGNGMALPNMLYFMEGIEEDIRYHEV